MAADQRVEAAEHCRAHNFDRLVIARAGRVAENDAPLQLFALRRINADTRKLADAGRHAIDGGAGLGDGAHEILAAADVRAGAVTDRCARPMACH